VRHFLGSVPVITQELSSPVVLWSLVSSLSLVGDHPQAHVGKFQGFLVSINLRAPHLAATLIPCEQLPGFLVSINLRASHLVATLIPCELFISCECYLVALCQQSL
jgi:hypothetical protein